MGANQRLGTALAVNQIGVAVTASYQAAYYSAVAVHVSDEVQALAADQGRHSAGRRIDKYRVPTGGKVHIGVGADQNAPSSVQPGRSLRR